MAFLVVAESGRDYDGADGFRPPDAYFSSSNRDDQKKIGSLEQAPNVDSSNQVEELVDIIEAAEITIRSQVANALVQETEQLRIALRAAGLQLQSSKIDHQKQSEAEGNGSSQTLYGRSRSSQGQSGAVQPYQHQNGSSLNVHSKSGRHGGLRNCQTGKKFNGASAEDNGRSIFPLPRRRGPEKDFRRAAYQGQGLPSELPDSSNDHGYQRSQDLVVRSTRTLEDDPVILKCRLMEASLKESQIISEKRILERRVAELRLAYDQQQQCLVDAASKALSYRQNVLEENIRMTSALQVAMQEKTIYVQSLMPLLAEFDLQPPVLDAHSMVSHIKILVQKLRSELELYENNGLEIVASYSQWPFSPAPQLRTGRPSWHSGVSSPHYGGSRDPDVHLGGSNEQESAADEGAIVPHESAKARSIEGLEDLEGDNLPYNGAGAGEDPSGRSDFNQSTSPQLPSFPEESMGPSFEDSDPVPGILCLRIVGDAVLGGRLTACGHSINGTSLCIFQWVRRYQDGTAVMIEGAAQPEYTITADDCDNMVAIECVPMDERGRRGDLVTVIANDGNWISRDTMMQDQINNYMANGQASFDVNLLIQEGASEEILEPATLVLRRANFELRRNSSRKVTINEKYAPDVLMKIPCGELLQCLIRREDGGRENYLELRDPKTRDMAVLTFRAFHKAAMDEKKKTRRKWLRS